MNSIKHKWDLYSWIILLHVLALPIMLFSRDNIVKTLVFVYIINDSIFHVHWVRPKAKRSNLFERYHFGVINLFIAYIVTRLLLVASLQEWVLAALLVVGYGMIVYMKGDKLKNEIFVHVYQWVGLLLILFCIVPSMNQPMQAPTTTIEKVYVGLGIVLFAVRQYHKHKQLSGCPPHMLSNMWRGGGASQ